MIVEGIVLSIIVGYIRKGKLSNFEHIDIRAWYLIILSQLMQIVAIRLNGTVFHINESIFYLIHILSYFVLIIPLVMNYRLISMRWLGIGTILNLIPIAFNGGQMPVYLPEGVNATFDLGHVLATSSTKAYWLADIIVIPKPYPLPKVISVGDVFLLVGAFLFVQYGMLNKGKS